jgi:hypothetical protein
MARYLVTGYFTTPVWVYVEADDEDEAVEIGSEMLIDGDGEENEGSWSESFDVSEEN